MHKVAIFEAKNKLTHIVRQVEAGAEVELTRHGKPVAVLVGIGRYSELQKERRRFSHAYSNFQTEWPISMLEKDELADNPFKDIRAKDSGRDVLI